MKTDVVMRSFSHPLSLLVSAQEYEEISNLIAFLEPVLNDNIHDKEKWAVVEKFGDMSRGNFENYHNREAGRPALKWPKEIGERAKYFRFIQSQLWHLYGSQKRRRAISIIASEFDWELDQALKDRLTDEKLFPTNLEIANICRAKKEPSLPKHLRASLDFTVQDKQTVISVSELCYKIKIGKKWIVLDVPKPIYLRDNYTKFSNPKIQEDKETGDLMVFIAYRVNVPKKKTPSAVLGVDSGFIKRFSGSVVRGNGVFSPELLPSKELERASEKLEKITKELKLVYARRDRLAPYLSGAVAPKTLISWEKAEEQAWFLRRKRTAVKERIAWLIARDIVWHARNQKAERINLEDLKFVSEKKKSVLWDFSRVTQRVTEVAELYGISVFTVSAVNTSQTDPFTRKKTGKRDSKRKVVTSAGKIDSDRSASLEIAQRHPRKAQKIEIVPLKKSGPLKQIFRAKPGKEPGRCNTVVVPAATKKKFTAVDYPVQTMTDNTKVLLL